jgi:hypothetical protein
MHPRLRNGAATRLAALGPRSRGRAIAPRPRAPILMPAAWRTSASAREQPRGTVHQLAAAHTALGHRNRRSWAGRRAPPRICCCQAAARIAALGLRPARCSTTAQGAGRDGQDWLGLAAGSGAGQRLACASRRQRYTRRLVHVRTRPPAAAGDRGAVHQLAAAHDRTGRRRHAVTLSACGRVAAAQRFASRAVYRNARRLAHVGDRPASSRRARSRPPVCCRARGPSGTAIANTGASTAAGLVHLRCETGSPGGWCSRPVGRMAAAHRATCGTPG